MKHVAMGVTQVTIIISHKISFYLLKMSVRNKLHNSKMTVVNQSQNLCTKIYCDVKQKHVSVGAYGPHCLCNSIRCHSWRMLTFHDENFFLLSISSFTEFDAAVPQLSGHSHVVRSLEPNHTLFVNYSVVNKILALHNPVWMVQKLYATPCILKENLNKRNNPAVTLYTTGEIIIVSWKIWTCKSTYKRSLISKSVAKWCVAIREFFPTFLPWRHQ
jgi:hypothetical protein